MGTLMNSYLITFKDADEPITEEHEGNDMDEALMDWCSHGMLRGLDEGTVTITIAYAGQRV